MADDSINNSLYNMFSPEVSKIYIKYIPEYKNYLKDVIFLYENINNYYSRLTDEKDENLKNIIMKETFFIDLKSNTNLDYFASAYRTILSELPEKEDSLQSIGKEVEINISKINNLNDPNNKWIHGIIIENERNNNTKYEDEPARVKIDNGEIIEVKDRNNIHLFKWKDCVNECYNICHNYVKNEVESTAYMLRILSASVLGDTKNYKICFFIDYNDNNILSKITGKWNQDKKFFKINIMKKSDEYNDADWFEKEQYNIIKLNTSVNKEIKSREQYLTIKIPNNKSIIELYDKNKNDVNNWTTKENGNLQFIRKYKNTIDVLDNFIVPRILNLNRTYIIINFLKILKAFTYDENNSYSKPDIGIFEKYINNDNILLNYDEEYKISNKVLLEGKDDNSNYRGLVDPGVGTNTKDNVNLIFNLTNKSFKKVTGLDLDIDIRNKLPDKDYRNLIRFLIEKLKQIQKEDTIIYQKTFNDEIQVTEPSGIIIKEDNQDSSTSTIKLPIEYTNKSNGRFILGAGPSASGKTYNAGLMIQMMKIVDPDFPGFFMTIDGGTYREKSVIYQIIVDAVINKNEYPGLTNLMSASIFSTAKSIFGTDSIKKVVNDYLLEQKNEKKFVVSLYVPDTLTFCGFPTNCTSKLKKYIKITGDDNWIGLMIYQHKTGGDGCPFKNKYKCVGCTESGKTREKTEGKKYSSSAWQMSYDHGLQTIQKAQIFKFVFHNGGRRGTPSIFEDLSTLKISYETNEEIKKFFDSKSIVYINGELTKNDNCDNYLLKDCKIHKRSQAEEDVLTIDSDFVKYYKNKYIAIPNKLIKFINDELKEFLDNIISNEVDNEILNDMDDNLLNKIDDEIALLFIIQKFVNSEFFVFSEMDPQKMEGTEANYNYYQINMFKFDYYNDYDDFNTLLEGDFIRLYELENEQSTISNLWKSASSVAAGFSSMFNFTPFATNNVKENLEELQKLDQVIINNPQLKNDIKNADVVAVNDIEISQKIKDNFGQDSNIKISEKTDEITGKPVTFVNVTGDKTSFMKWFTKTIQKSVESLTGVFINRELIDTQGETQGDAQGDAQGETQGDTQGDAQGETQGDTQGDAQGETQGETQGEVKTENAPLVMTLNEVVNNSSPKKRYIGIPTSINNKDDNTPDKEALKYLIDHGYIQKINVNQKLLENTDNYDENLYDYYEITNIEEKVYSHLKKQIELAKLEFSLFLGNLSKENTLYIYETETEPEETTNVNNLQVSNLFKSFVNTFKTTSKAVSSLIPGTKSKTTEDKKEEIDESIIETNNKPPKCNKKTTVKNMNSQTSKKTKKNINNNTTATRVSPRNNSAVNYKT